MTSPEGTAPAPQPSASPPPPPPPPAAGAQPAAPAAPAGPSALDNLVASMGMAQLLIVGGALLLVLVDLLLGIIVNEYYASALVWLGSAVVLVAYLANRQRPGSLPVDHRTLLLGAAAVIALIGLRDIVIEAIDVLRFTSSWDAVELLGLLLYVVGIAAVAFGGWQLWRGRR